MDSILSTDLISSGRVKINDNFDSLAKFLDSDEKAALAGTLGIPSADNPFATHADLEQMVIEVQADLLELNYQAISYIPEITPDVAAITQLSAHLAGIDAALQSIQSRLDDIEAAME